MVVRTHELFCLDKGVIARKAIRRGGCTSLLAILLLAVALSISEKWPGRR